MPAPELVGQSSVFLGEPGTPGTEWRVSLERRMDNCGASTSGTPDGRDSNFRIHTAWRPELLLPGGAVRIGCRLDGVPNITEAFIQTCGPFDRNDPDSWDGLIRADCVGCSCEDIGLGTAGNFRGVGFFCRLGQGVMLWTNADVEETVGERLPGFDPDGNTWGLGEFYVFKSHGCITNEDCLGEYPEFRAFHLDLRGCGCCIDNQDPFRSCGLLSELPACIPWVSSDCNETVEGANQGTLEEKRAACECINDPFSFICQVNAQRNNRPYWASRWCQRGHGIGQLTFVGQLRGNHTHVDDTVVQQNFDKFWVIVDFEDSQFCTTQDWGRFVGVSGHKMTVRHRMDSRASNTGLVPLEFNPAFQGWKPTPADFIEGIFERGGFRDHVGGPFCAYHMGANRNGRTVEGPFPWGQTIQFSGVGP